MGYAYSEILSILRDPREAYSHALKNDINIFLNRGCLFLQGNKIFKLKNILAEML